MPGIGIDWSGLSPLYLTAAGTLNGARLWVEVYSGGRELGELDSLRTG